MDFEYPTVESGRGVVTECIRRQGNFCIEEQRAFFADVLEFGWKTLVASRFDDQSAVFDPKVGRFGSDTGQVEDEKILLVGL